MTLSVFELRAGGLFLTLLCACTVFLAVRPSIQELKGAGIGVIWVFPSLIGLNLLAQVEGWWFFQTQGGALFGLPLDIMGCWACLWGGVIPVLCQRVSLLWVLVGVLFIDVTLMPQLEPVLLLGPNWLWGEGLLMVCCLIPSIALFRWYSANHQLMGRMVLYGMAYVGYYGLLAPALMIELFSVSLPTLWKQETVWWVQFLLIPVSLGVASVQAFVREGNGTPVPWDPPSRLVTSGPYAYIRNPMQLSSVLLYGWLGLWLEHWIFGVAALSLVAFSEGLARWTEENALTHRFGASWQDYSYSLKNWWPRWIPSMKHGKATVYIAQTCLTCSALQQWIEARHPVGLTIVPAEEIPAGLNRITYVSVHGVRYTGVKAVFQVWNHLHLGWAWTGWLFGLPGLCQCIQVLMDGVGASPSHVGPVRCERK